MSLRTSSQLASAHWIQSSIKGLVWLIPFMAAGIPLYLIYTNDGPFMLESKQGYDGEGLVRRFLIHISNWIEGTMIAILLGAIFLGIPALLVGILRIWPMKWLFGSFLSYSTPQSITTFLIGVFFIFEVPVVLATALGGGFSPGSSFTQLTFCQLVSLPWICSSLQVGRQLIREEMSRRDEFLPPTA